MCQRCEYARRTGYTETVRFRCGFCSKFVFTEWYTNGGILHGEYEVIGDVVFHDKCADIYLLPLNERTA